MKNSILYTGILFVLFSFLVQGQTSKGSWLIAGTSNFRVSSGISSVRSDTSNGMSDDFINIIFSPQVGYFLVDDLVCGLQTSLLYNDRESGDNDITTVAASIGPFVRYYFSNTSNNIRPIIQSSANYGYMESFGLDSYNTKMYSFQLGGGLAIFLKESISIDFTIEYILVSEIPDDTTDLRLISNGLSGGFGVSVLL